MKINLYNGNCLDIMPTIDDASIDMILCDLPYGTTDCKWDIVIPFADLWREYNRVIKPNGAIVLFGIEPFSSYLRLSNIKDYRYDWYWQKEKGTNFLRANYMPFKVIETASVFYKEQPTYNPEKKLNPNGVHGRSNYTYSDKSFNGELLKNAPKQTISSSMYEPEKVLPTQLLKFNRDREWRIHPTQKPVALLEYLIRTYTNKGELVLDNTMGSGSTGVACWNMDRSFIGIEQNTEYFTAAQERIELYKNQLKLPFDIG